MLTSFCKETRNVRFFESTRVNILPFWKSATYTIVDVDIGGYYLVWVTGEKRTVYAESLRDKIFVHIWIVADKLLQGFCLIELWLANLSTTEKGIYN